VDGGGGVARDGGSIEERAEGRAAAAAAAVVVGRVDGQGKGRGDGRGDGRERRAENGMASKRRAGSVRLGPGRLGVDAFPFCLLLPPYPNPNPNPNPKSSSFLGSFRFVPSGEQGRRRRGRFATTNHCLGLGLLVGAITDHCTLVVTTPTSAEHPMPPCRSWLHQTNWHSNC
jgi:hypothetical protein